MNKFKAWLIRKLGGYVYLSEIEPKAHLSDVRIIRQTLPNAAVNTDEYVRSYDDPESFCKSNDTDLYKDWRQGKDGF